MSDEVYRQTRKKIDSDEVPQNETYEDPLESIKAVQQAAAQETGETYAPMSNPENDLQIKGNIPPEFREAMQKRGKVNNPSTAPRPASNQLRLQGSGELEGLLQRLADHSSWEEIDLPSKGKFYQNIPNGGSLIVFLK